MKGFVDVVNQNSISGWCFDEMDIDKVLKVELYVNSIKIDEKYALIHRPSLQKKGLHPTGNVGFLFVFKNNLLSVESHLKIKVKEKNFLLDTKKAYNKFIEQNLLSRDKIKNNKCCIVHIGMHKTGSSSIQENLSHNKNNKNFSYIELGMKNHSVPLYTLFTNNQKTNDYVTKLGYSDEEIEKFKREIDDKFQKHLVLNNKCTTFVLSGEGLTVLSIEELKKFKQYLLIFFEKIEIVAYVRSPIAYINSMFQERVKGGSANFATLDKLYPNYRAKLQKFDTLFGKENVSLFYFTKDRLYGGDVTFDFLEKNHLKVVNKNFIISNESLSLESTALLYVYYKFGPGYGTGKTVKIENNNLLTLFQKFGSKKVEIGSDVLNTLLASHQDDMEWIENRLENNITDEKNYLSNVDDINTENDLVKVAQDNLELFEKYIRKKYRINQRNDTQIEDIVAVVDSLRKEIRKEKSS